MNVILVNGGYTLMLCALVARDILWLRGTLVEQATRPQPRRPFVQAVV